MFALTILGCNSAIAAYGRNPTAQALQVLDETFLIDCGEGTQMQLARYKVKWSKISRIFISHLHGDHYFGLPGLLSTMGLLGRSQDLHLYAPPELEDILQMQLDVTSATLPYPFYFHPITKPGVICNTQHIQVNTFPVVHGIPCWGFTFKEIRNPRRIIPERVKAYEIPSDFYSELQHGKDFVNAKGTIIPNNELTDAAPSPRTYAYCADTIYDEAMIPYIQHADLLYHETTYPAEQAELAAKRFHSTTNQAANIAHLSKAKKLIIGHFSSRYEKLDIFLKEASAIFPDTELAVEGTCYAL